VERWGPYKRTRLKEVSHVSDLGLQKEDWREAVTTRTYPVSEKRALEIAAWARIVGGALEREANSAFWAGELERATSFLPLISYTERLADFRS
jgi:hypothetical protein